MQLKLKFALIVISLSLSLLSACSQKSVIRKGNLKSSATIQELMLSLIVPADDAIWDAGSSVVTAAGVAGKQPHTAEEWAVAGQHAAKLLDGAKLLSEGGRLVAIKDSKSESPDFKGSPEEIQQLIDQKPELFFNYAQQFQLAAEETLAAIDAKNSTALLEAGSRVDEACEQCHKIFWYPSQFKPKP